MQKRGFMMGIVIFVVVLIIAFLIGGYLISKNKWIKFDNFKDKQNNSIPNEIVIDIGTNGSCSSNNDCIPASCCHATTCTNKEKAPICDRILCTQQCVPGTLDCGQGS